MIRDDGYRAKWTKQHNTLIIDGKGQFGEGKMWFDGDEALQLKSNPHMDSVVSTPVLDHMTGNATDAYPKDLGLQRYIRHLLYLKPIVLIVVDDILLDSPKTLEIFFHPESEEAERSGKSFLLQGKQAVLLLELLNDDGVELNAGQQNVSTREGENDDTMFAVNLKTNRRQWHNAVAISWSQKGISPIRITFQAEKEIWRFTAVDCTVLFNWETGEAQCIY